MKSFLIFILLSICISSIAQHEVPFTLEDRDRLMRLEVMMKERFESIENYMKIKFESIDRRFESLDRRFESIDRRFESIDKRFESLENIMLWGFGVVFSLALFTLGYLIWDRRTALNPLREKTYEIKEKTNAIESEKNLIFKIFKEFATKEPKFAEVLKTYGLL
ncbi:MAG: hypothetical protein HY738_07555 [Bacteroidia bacterium]|nr:hypothetical protein [Bacteroidia bacterium]